MQTCNFVFSLTGASLLAPIGAARRRTMGGKTYPVLVPSPGTLYPRLNAAKPHV